MLLISFAIILAQGVDGFPRISMMLFKLGLWRIQVLKSVISYSSSRTAFCALFFMQTYGLIIYYLRCPVGGVLKGSIGDFFKPRSHITFNGRNLTHF